MDAGANQKDRINFGNSILKTKTLIHTLILIPSHISFSLAKKIHYLYLREGFKKKHFLHLEGGHDWSSKNMVQMCPNIV